MNTFETEDFKIADSTSYNNVSDQYDRFVELFSARLPALLIAMAKIKPSQQVLDVGTGTGIVALEVARHLAGTGRVLGIDLSEGMLATAETKAKQLKLHNIEFQSMDAEALEYNDNSFDVVVSLYALRHFPHPEIALKEMYRVLRPGGKIAIAVGSSPSLLTVAGWLAGLRYVYNRWLQFQGKRLIACNYLDSLIDRFLPEPGALEVTQWSHEHSHFTGSVVKLAKLAGFDQVQSKWLGQQEIIETTDDFWDLQITFSSKARKRMAQTSTAEFQEIKKEFIKTCDEVKARGGKLIYPTGTLFVYGKRP